MKKFIIKALKKIASVAMADTNAQVATTRAEVHKVHQKVAAFEAVIKKVDKPSVSNIDRLERALDRAENYQPLYGLEGLGVGSKDVSRSNSRDRSKVVADALGGDIHGLRVIDVGSSLGYVSFYLADRGAQVEGWDFRAQNVEVANLVNTINGVEHVSFKTREMTLDIVKGIPTGRYDAVVILSVLHHTIMYNGLEYAQDLMAELLSRVPVVIVELAQKGETEKHADKGSAKFAWDKSLPKKDLEIFDKAKKLGIEIEKIADFNIHLAGTTRPMYKISRDHVTVDNRNFPFDKLSRKAYQGADIPNPRVFYKGAEHFIKEYALTRSGTDVNKIQIVNEINFYLSTKDSKIPNIPRMETYEINDTSAYIVLGTIDGALLDDANQVTLELDIDAIARDLLETLAALEQENLHHNDIRSWNIILGRKGVTLIDFGLVGATEIENNKIAFLWLLHAAITHERESTDRNKTDLPSRAAFTYEHTLKIYDAIEKDNDTTFVELLKIG